MPADGRRTGRPKKTWRSIFCEEKRARGVSRSKEEEKTVNCVCRWDEKEKVSSNWVSNSVFSELLITVAHLMTMLTTLTLVHRITANYYKHTVWWSIVKLCNKIIYNHGSSESINSLKLNCNTTTQWRHKPAVYCSDESTRKQCAAGAWRSESTASRSVQLLLTGFQQRENDT